MGGFKSGYISEITVDGTNLYAGGGFTTAGDINLKNIVRSDIAATLTVNIEPEAVRSAGARWSIDGGTTWHQSGTLELHAGNYTVSFNQIAGWDAPDPINVTLERSSTVTRNAAYTRHTGTLTVNIAVRSAGARWSIDGGTTWYQSGTRELPVGNYTVSFNQISGWDAPDSINVTLEHSFTVTRNVSYTRHTGTLAVYIGSTGARSAEARWSVDGGTTWHESGEQLTLDTGDYSVAFNVLEHWVEPADLAVSVTKNSDTTETESYTRAQGTLTVSISPAGVRSAGARWSVDGGTTWHESGQMLPLNTGDYTVTFNELEYWVEPAAIEVEVAKNKASTETATYRAIGTLTVDIVPVGARDAGARWSIDGGTTWYVSGEILSLSTGDYTVTYNELEHWVEPADQEIRVTKNKAITETASYRAAGTLTVNIAPVGAKDAGARWSIDGGTTWHKSGTQKVPTGIYDITFNETSGWDAPADITGILVEENTTVEESLSTYNKALVNNPVILILVSFFFLLGAITVWLVVHKRRAA